MLKGLVIIPTYNEIENIGRIIPEVLKQGEMFDVLVVDDGSPDGTADKVRELQRSYADRIYMLERKGKLGLGTAYIAGFKWGIKEHYDLIFEMDADFSHNPEDLNRMVTKIHDDVADVVVGSRYVKNGDVENWPLDRWMLSYGASFYVRMITQMPVKDPTAGFICYRRQVLESLDLNNIKFIGYAFQIEMKFKSYIQGFRIVEIPILFKDREEGISKMNSSIIKEAVFGVIQMRWASLFGKKQTQMN